MLFLFLSNLQPVALCFSWDCTRAAGREKGQWVSSSSFYTVLLGGACDSVAFLIRGPSLLGLASDSNCQAGEAHLGPRGQLGCRAGRDFAKGKPALHE